jgi:membrane protease YdiL (CAAX protease family)
MSLAGRTSRAAGSAALLAVGALALHQLRYLLAYGGEAGTALESQGHSYLDTAAPLLVAVAVALLVVSVLIPAFVRLAPVLARDVCATERAAGYAAALLAVYFAQELAEGVLAGGHPAGLAGVLGFGGWLALPLAMALGALASVVRGWLYRAERSLATALGRRRLPRPQRRAPAPPRPSARPALSSLALRFGFARRPPPLALHA